MRKKLNARFVETVKPPAQGRVDYWDSSLPGFGLRVSDRGTKTWVLKYNKKFNGKWKSKRFSLGRYPSLKLADAKGQAQEQLKLVSKGKDPALEKEKKRLGITVKEMADQYLEKHAKKKKRSWRKDQAMLDHDILPIIGGLSPKEVTRDSIEKIIYQVERRGAPIQANRVFEVVRGLFNWGLGRYVEINPCYRMGKPNEEIPRNRNLKNEEIRKIWKHIEKGTKTPDGKLASMNEQTQIALKLLLLTGQRVGEITQAVKDEFDMEEKLWVIPATRTKNRRAHRIPLPNEAQKLIKKASKIASKIAEKKKVKDDFLFPASFLREKPKDKRWKSIGTTSLNHALRRVLEHSNVKDVRPHDFREAVATGMASLGVPEVHIGAVLNHVRGGVTSVHYNRYPYEKEKRIALEAWERKLFEILLKRAPQKSVIAFSAKSKS